MHVCCVPKCGNRRNAGKGYRLHQFPRNDLDRYNRWVEAIGNVKIRRMPREQVVKCHYVCSAHFSADQFFLANRNRSNLRLDSIPNLKLPLQDCADVTAIPVRQQKVPHERCKPLVKAIKDTTEATVILQEQQEIIVGPPQPPVAGGLLAEYLMSSSPVELYHSQRAELSSNGNCQNRKEELSLIRRCCDLCKELHQCKQQLHEMRSTEGLLRMLAGRLDPNLLAAVKTQLIQTDKAAKELC